MLKKRPSQLMTMAISLPKANSSHNGNLVLTGRARAGAGSTGHKPYCTVRVR